MKSYLSKLGVLLFGAMFAVAACQDYDEDIRKVNDKLDGATAELTEITEELDAAIADLEAKHDADLKKVNEDLQKASAAAEAAITALDAAYKSADAALKNELMGEDARLQQQIKAAVDQATAALTALETAYKAADDELAKAYKAADDAVKTEVLAYVDGKVAALNKTIEDLKAADKALEEAYKAADAGLQKNIDAAIANAAAELARVENALKTAEATLNASINEHAERLTAAEQDIVDLQEELEAAKEELEAAIEAEAAARDKADEALEARVTEAYKTAIKVLADKQEEDFKFLEGLIKANKTAIDQEIADREEADKQLEEAYKAAIEAEAKAREEADAALEADIKAKAEALANALKDLEDKLSEMINENAAAIEELKKVDEQLKEKIGKVAADLEEFKTFVAETYATQKALDELHQYVNDIKYDVAGEFQGVLATIETLNNTLHGLSVNVEALMGRVKSIVFAPDYTRNVAFVEFAVVLPSAGNAPVQPEAMILPKLSLIRYKVDAANAAEVAKDIALAWTAKKDILSYTLESVATTRAAVENDEELVIRNVEAEGEYLYVWVTAENFNKCFYTGRPTNNEPVNSYAASLRFSDGNNDYATAYVVLAPIDEPMELEVKIATVQDGDERLDSYYGEEAHTLGVNETDTLIHILPASRGVLANGGLALTDEQLAEFPTVEIEFEEKRDYTDNANTDSKISDDSFIFTGEGKTETAQLAKALTKASVGEVLTITHTYTFGPSVATAVTSVRLTAERRFITVYAQYPEGETAVPWTLQRALDLRADDTTPYGKPLTTVGKYEFPYPLDYVLAPATGKTVTKKTYLNNKIVNDKNLFKMKNMEAAQVDIVLAGYEFPEAEADTNVYKAVWTSETEELYVEVTVECKLAPRPATVVVERDVKVELVPGKTYFDGSDAIVEAAYDELTEEYAGFNETNSQKPNTVLLAALNDAANIRKNTPDYINAINFVVAEDDTDESFIRLHKNPYLNKVFELKRTIETWFGVDFEFKVNVDPQLPENYLIASEDYMKKSQVEGGLDYVEVFGKINSEGVYTIDLADLGKYLGVTIGDGKDETRTLEHNLDVKFEILNNTDVILSDSEVEVDPEAEPVAEKSGILRFGQLANDEAIVDWNNYEGTVVNVKASLIAEDVYTVNTKEFQLVTKDPLAFEFGDTIKVTRVPGLSANAKIYENVSLTSTVEPSVENLIDNSAPSLKEIFATSHADKTYGIKTTATFGGVFVDKEMMTPYSTQKYSYDMANGTVTLHADDGQLLYPLYAKVILEFEHNIHGEETVAKEIVIVFEPSEAAKVMMNKFTNGGEIRLEDDLLLTQSLVIDNPNAVVTLDLGGKTIQNISKELGSEQYALHVKQGTLIIKGDGTVDGGSGCLNNIALRVDGAAVAYIEGGHFKVGADQDGDENNCILAADGGKVFISGGKFQSAPKKGTVPAVYTTLLTSGAGAIEVTGGEFVNFNPTTPTNYVKTGYKSVLKQYSTTDYIVEAE